MDTADSPRSHHELARLTDLPPALRGPLPPAARPAGGGGGLSITPRTVLRGLARHWWQALALWVVGSAALGVTIYLTQVPTYRATSLLRINSVVNPYSPRGEVPQSSSYVATQIQLITSPNVLSAAAQDRKVLALESVREAPDAEDFLRQSIRVEPRYGTELIEVSATSRRPNEAATIVNAVVAAFNQADAEWSEARNLKSIRDLETYALDVAAKVEAQQTTLFQLTRDAEDPGMVIRSLAALGDAANGVRSSEGEGQDHAMVVDVSEYRKLHQRLLDLEYEKVEAESELESIRRQAAATDPRVWVERRVEQVFLADPNVREIREQLRDVDARLQAARRTIRGPGDPALGRMQVERQRLLERYEQLWGDLEPALRARLADEESNPTQLVRRAEARLADLEQQRVLVQQKLDKIDLEDRSRGIDALRMQFAAAKLYQYRAMEDQVQARLEVLRFESRGNEPISVIDAARVNNQPLASKRDKYLAFTPLAMLGLVLGLVTLVEMRSGRVGGTEELSGRLSAEVFAVPPLPTTRSSGRLEGPGRDPKFEQFVQQLDHVRVALCGEGGHDGRGRCVLITSAVGGEGKTTLAAQLAVRCAEAGASTVLIDADLRRATLGRLFEVPDCPGLSDVLRGDAKLEDALVPISQVGGCQLLPAGSPEANPNRILHGKAFAPMLERLRRSFDVVIIDTSPVLPVPDALILGRLADGAVLATRHDQSRFPAVERANGLLAGAGIPVLGVVVNGARSSDRRFGTGYATYAYRSDRMPGDVPPTS